MNGDTATITSIESAEAFEKVRAPWEQLYSEAASPNIFRSHRWLSCWLRHFAAPGVTALLQWEQPQVKLRAAALFRADQHNWSWIESQHSDYPGVLHRIGNDTPLTPLLSYIEHNYDVRRIDLVDSPADAAFERQLKHASGSSWCLLEFASRPLRFLDLPGSFADYLQTRPSKVRHELKRKVRRFERDSGGDTFSCFTDTADLDTVFAAISEIESDSWKAATQTSIGCSDQESAFYRDVFQTYAQESALRAYVLKRNGQPVAYVLGIVQDGIYYALKTSYRQAFAKLSPGLVLFARAIDDLCNERPDLNRIELLGNDSRWKKELGSGENHVRSYRLLRAGPSARLQAFAHTTLRPAASRWLHDLEAFSEREPPTLTQRALKHALPWAKKIASRVSPSL